MRGYSKDLTIVDISAACHATSLLMNPTFRFWYQFSAFFFSSFAAYLVVSSSAKYIPNVWDIKEELLFDEKKSFKKDTQNSLNAFRLNFSLDQEESAQNFIEDNLIDLWRFVLKLMLLVICVEWWFVCNLYVKSISTRLNFHTKSIFQ